MYFKKLELVGFKSFCEKTTLHFEPGITTIVGPNGCGKSNIFDSIRWVLGEQSAKSLRGSEMQDVIFNGTDSKEPLSMAEATLTFDNSNKFFTFDHHEVAITRRIFRSGESEYLLNKSPVRLKDILDLLMGTGIGAESYSIVAQGKIDLVLSSRPEDRRLVFDEASGITKYKAQKKEAMRKLEETEQNLLRINDIILEVKRQIGSLERQANKARKYKEVFDELKLKETNLSVLERKDLIIQKNEIISQLTELGSEELRLLEIIKEEAASISNRQSELNVLEDNIMGAKNELLNMDNLIIRDNERIAFNKERIIELGANKQNLQSQIEQIKSRLVLDEEKLNSIRQEYDGIKKSIEDKATALNEKEGELNNIVLAIRSSLDKITVSKKSLIDLEVKISNVKNQITDLASKAQIYLARKKRLELERTKVGQEKSATETSLNAIMQEISGIKETIEGLNSKISGLKDESEQERTSLDNINTETQDLERQVSALQSHREFLQKLKTKYDDISESMNATIYLDKFPSERITGLVIKINSAEETNLKLSGEAKPIELDTSKIQERINQIEQQLDELKNVRVSKEGRIQDLNKSISALEQELRNEEIALANKDTCRQATLEQFNKIKEEEDIINLELSDLQKELATTEEKLAALGLALSDLEKTHNSCKETVSDEQNSIALNSDLKEKTLVLITQLKTELEALERKIISDEATLRILEETYNQDKASLIEIERQIRDAENKILSLGSEITDSENRIKELGVQLKNKNTSLKDLQVAHRQRLDSTSDVTKKIEADRANFDILKNKLFELHMQDKEIDFKYQGLKDRMLAAYKIDLEAVEDLLPHIDRTELTPDIQRLKEKLDSYGAVNLVAIEEYDELKKRYDFLVQQQTDLNVAKESLHEALLKINRTTRKMFLETFEKVREEFRNYFRLLFNGGDAQVFLTDEHDPLESGIEIICRPPGKKLQNVLLLSGGEKSLSATALIFAIFKVKPSPFCILDEIDAALDEANVDRFARALQEFAKESQFIVITHNKKTIAGANVMYGITMEESGVSKIVSVKFGEDRGQGDTQPDDVVEPASV